MDDKLIERLQSAINEAEADPRDYFYFVSSLGTAKGTLSAIINPPHNSFSVTGEIDEETVVRVIWHLKNSMENRI